MGRRQFGLPNSAGGAQNKITTQEAYQGIMSSLELASINGLPTSVGGALDAAVVELNCGEVGPWLSRPAKLSSNDAAGCVGTFAAGRAAPAGTLLAGAVSERAEMPARIQSRSSIPTDDRILDQ